MLVHCSTFTCVFECLEHTQGKGSRSARLTESTCGPSHLPTHWELIYGRNLICFWSAPWLDLWKLFWHLVSRDKQPLHMSGSVSWKQDNRQSLYPHLNLLVFDRAIKQIEEKRICCPWNHRVSYYCAGLIRFDDIANHMKSLMRRWVKRERERDAATFQYLYMNIISFL